MTDLKVGIAGLGTIGKKIAEALQQGMPGLTLCAVSSGSHSRAENALAAIGSSVPVVDAAALALMADIVVECAPTAAFLDIAQPALQQGRTLVTVSGAAILQHPEVVEQARTGNGKIVLATGALLGLDAVRAAAEGVIHSVTMVTRKPPRSLLKAKHIVEHNIDISNLSEPLQVFAGSAREGAEKFPSNVNVAAALGLAGIGPEHTQLEIWADPALERNTHFITVDADSARLELKIENVPTEENPGTGKITALSVIAALRSLGAPMRVGT
jgi:aspartate dehydrogenase